jgi:EpsI family protein
MISETLMHHIHLQKNLFSVFILIVTAFILISFSETIHLLINYWLSDSSYSHGPLIACISFYLLFWHHKLALVNTKTKAMPFAIPLFIASLFIWWSATVISIQVLQVMSLPLIILSLFYCLWGKEIFRIALFPVMFIYLSIPVWTLILSPLQNMTLWVNSMLINFIKIPAFIEGTNVHIPAGIFSIEHGCAGLKYFLASISTILLMAYLSRASLQAKFLSLMLAIFTALIANWIRVFFIIVIGHKSDMQHAIVNDHSNFGWLVFAALFLPLLFFCHKLLPVPLKKSTISAISSPTEIESALIRNNRPKQFLTALLLATLVLIITDPLSPQNIKSERLSSGIKLPKVNIHWTGPTTLNDDSEIPLFYGFDEIAYGSYKKNHQVAGETVTMSIIHYQNQQQGSELIHYENKLYNENLWSNVEHKTIILIADNANTKKSINQITLESANKRRKLIYYWYEIGRYSTTSKIEAKLLQIPSLINQRSDASLYCVSINCKDLCENEMQSIHSLLTQVMSQSTSLSITKH